MVRFVSLSFNKKLYKESNKAVLNCWINQWIIFAVKLWRTDYKRPNSTVLLHNTMENKIWMPDSGVFLWTVKQ